ncbi:MAG TPA: sugar phosphate isomerase/epimerase [Ilumatobacteraceae bacterium]|nr:sugar phosphate isomerase/epimerase [Ilumatobacteraceae bacterium]
MSTPEISLQLYSVRNRLTEDPRATLEAVRSIGFRHVELFDFVDRADEYARLLSEVGLSAPTAHASFVDPERVTLEPDRIFDAAARVGAKTVIEPYVAPARWNDGSEIAMTADRLNELVPQAAAHDLTIGYHNHAHELEPRIDGKHALEYFADLLAPEVLLEVDLYWAAAGGADLVPLLQGLGDRVRFVHVKDGALPGSTEDQVPAGQGDVPLDAALDAASHAELAVVEFDAFRGDILQGVADSFSYLTAKGLR